MTKEKNFRRWLWVIPLAALMVSLVLPIPAMAGYGTMGGCGGGGGGCGGSGGGSGGGGAVGTPTAVETYWMTYMREEEKLARDVYLYMYSKYRVNMFSGIANSEQKHMDAVKGRLDAYGLPDPAAGNAKGVFSNQQLQDLYNQLINKGKVSLVDAYEVGVIVEETDIADLQQGIDTSTHSDIVNVFSNLQAASYNHLSAFQSRL